jgi:nucleotide-binding universal stress UspA family protein
VAKAVYRQAIDPSARDGEGAAWWSEVVDEIRDVIAARSVSEAAAVIDWWHNDWSAVSDTPRDAAKRIRESARTLRLNAQEKRIPRCKHTGD